MTQLFMTHPAPLSSVGQSAIADGLELRSATIDDAAEIAGVLAESFEENWDAARVVREFFDAADVVNTWVVSDPAGIVGTASERLMPEVYKDAGYVHYVGVLRRARGRRVGAILTERCIRGFAERGLATAVLETDDFRIPALITYFRLGFIPTYRTAEEQGAWSRLLPRLFGAAA